MSSTGGPTVAPGDRVRLEDGAEGELLEPEMRFGSMVYRVQVGESLVRDVDPSSLERVGGDRR